MGEGLSCGFTNRLVIGVQKKKKKENEKEERNLGGTKDWKHFLLPLDTKKRTKRRLEGQIIIKNKNHNLNAVMTM